MEQRGRRTNPIVEIAEQTLLKVQGLGCVRNNREIFRNLTFNLSFGSWLHVTGSNGAGKSSLLKILVGLIPMESGNIVWLDKGKDKDESPNKSKDKNKDKSIDKKDFNYIGHKLGIQPHLTVLENLKWWLAIQDDGRQTFDPDINDLSIDDLDIDKALEYWELDILKKTACEQLSAGQCQRLALARLMLKPSKLWVLDEPCNSLDAGGINLFESLFEKHLGRGRAAIVVSHLPLHLSSYEDRKSILEMTLLARNEERN